MNAQEIERASSFCSVPLPGLVYAGPRTRAEFDRIDLPETVHEWKADEITTLIKHDGRQWERRCHSKELSGAKLCVLGFMPHPWERRCHSKELSGAKLCVLGFMPHPWERRCHSKELSGDSNGPVRIVFQWFDERPVDVPAQGGAA